MKTRSPRSWRRFRIDALRGLAAVLVTATIAAAQPVPILFDTDIGTDIDDAYALALILKSPELDLVGVTTVSGDAVARARLAAKLLAVAGGAAAKIPVYAGTSTGTQYMKQAEWATGFTSPALHPEGGVAFMRQQIEARPGQLTIVAVGELTNVAALLRSSPDIAKKIKGIALMGGAVRRGGQPGSAPQPEWNIKSNAAAAKTVFTSGVPLTAWAGAASTERWTQTLTQLRGIRDRRIPIDNRCDARRRPYARSGSCDSPVESLPPARAPDPRPHPRGST